MRGMNLPRKRVFDYLMINNKSPPTYIYIYNFDKESVCSKGGLSVGLLIGFEEETGIMVSRY